MTQNAHKNESGSQSGKTLADIVVRGRIFGSTEPPSVADSGDSSPSLEGSAVEPVKTRGHPGV